MPYYFKQLFKVAQSPGVAYLSTPLRSCGRQAQVGEKTGWLDTGIIETEVVRTLSAMRLKAEC